MYRSRQRLDSRIRADCDAVYSLEFFYVSVSYDDNDVRCSVNYICRDYLGSITHVTDSAGTLRQELSYDAWGRLRNPSTHALYPLGMEPWPVLGRGFTGHEYLPVVGIINMNARLYDSATGRFLSPDPYVQMPDFSQSFNRYSYCMNNPLRYVDKDGEFLLVAAGILIGAYIGGTMANNGELNPFRWNWKDATTYLGMGFGAVLGGVTVYGFVNPGTIGYTFGVNNAWGTAAVTIGGTGFKSNWNLKWSTKAGSGGNVSLGHSSYEELKRQSDSRFFHGSLNDASELLVYLSKSKEVEMAMYKTDYGYYFDKSEGYVFSLNEINNERFVFSGMRPDGQYMYYVSNEYKAGTLFSIRNRRDGRPYLDLGLGQRFDVREMYHTHPGSTRLSPDDPFQGVIPTYAVGWDGIMRGAYTDGDEGPELDEVVVIGNKK